jgi:hypothetical protein
VPTTLARDELLTVGGTTTFEVRTALGPEPSTLTLLGPIAPRTALAVEVEDGAPDLTQRVRPRAPVWPRFAGGISDWTTSHCVSVRSDG